MHAHGAADVEHACAEPCLNAEERCDTLHNSTLVGLGDITHAIVIRNSSVKPVLCLSANLHHLHSDGAAFNTQSCSSLTSYTISCSLIAGDSSAIMNTILHSIYRPDLHPRVTQRSRIVE